MDEKKIDEMRKLRDAGKITDDDFRAMVAGEVESSTTTDAPLDESSDLKDAGYSSTDDYSVMTYIDGMEYGVEYGSDDMFDTSMDGLKSTLGY